VRHHFRKPGRRPTGGTSTSAGMTLIELSVSMVVLAVAVSATLASITSFAGLESANERKIEAYLSVRRTIETMQASQFGDTFALYNADPADDPVAGLSPGPGFAVAGLTAPDGDPDGLAGLVRFPINGAGELREDLNDPDFGLPRDLNADGIIDALDHSGDYVVLPARVRVDWADATGPRFVEISTLLSIR